VWVGGSADFYGVLYAPSADITRNGNSDFFGVCVGKSITATGSGGMHYDEAIGYTIVYADGEPSEIYFAGYSFD